MLNNYPRVFLKDFGLAGLFRRSHNFEVDRVTIAADCKIQQGRKNKTCDHAEQGQIIESMALNN
jgi:hypothetical protein